MERLDLERKIPILMFLGEDLVCRLGIDNLRHNSTMKRNLIRVAVRFFSGVLHPHLLGVCYPDRFFNKEND